MANVFLENKIAEIKNGLGAMSAAELSDLKDSTRSKFDVHLIAEDRELYLDLLKSIHQEAARRNPSTPGIMREFSVSNELRTEMDSMDSEQLAKAIKGSQAAVFGAEYVNRNSPEYRAEYQRLTALNLEQTRRAAEEKEQQAAEMRAERQREIALEIAAKKAAETR